MWLLLSGSKYLFKPLPCPRYSLLFSLFLPNILSPPLPAPKMDQLEQSGATAASTHRLKHTCTGAPKPRTTLRVLHLRPALPIRSRTETQRAAFQLGKVSNLWPERLPAARASFSLRLSSPASPPTRSHRFPHISAGPRPAPAKPPPASRAYLPLRQVLVRPQQVRRQEGLGRPEAGEETVGAEQRGGQEPALAWDPSCAQEHGGRRRPPGHRAGHDHPEGGDTAPSFFSFLPTRMRLKRCP